MFSMVRRLTRKRLDWDHYALPAASPEAGDAADSDWRAVQAVCGYSREDFAAANAPLPLSAASIRHFCRNHRECDMSLGGQFEALDSALPEPLAILYSIYLSQARIDAEASLFLAQSGGATRVAAVMGDLLAIGAFGHGVKSVNVESRAFAIAAAFDTVPVIDAANQEAEMRLALPSDHEDHLLRLSPDAVGLLAVRLAAQHRLGIAPFIKKAQQLAEARQDVNRFPAAARFATALAEGDLPADAPWVQRLVAAMQRLFPAWTGMAVDAQKAPHHNEAA